MTWRLLDLHDKPIAILNRDGYWDSLLEFLSHAEAEECPGSSHKLFRILPGLPELGHFFDGLNK